MAIAEEPIAIAACTEVISAAAQTEILGKIDTLLGYFPDGSAADQPPSSPDWANMPPEMGSRVSAYLTALRTAIDAAPTS